MKSLTRDEVRALDRCAIETLAVPGVVLMENAGRNAAAEIDSFLGGCRGKAVAVVAGAGNNGGDGFVIARHLSMRGARVVTFLIAPAEKVVGDAATNLAIIKNLALPVHILAESEMAQLGSRLSDFDLVVDAVGGTGVSGPLRGGAAEAVNQINASARPVVAVDIPSGLDCDLGVAPGPAVRAALTVTFAARKKGFDVSGAEAYTGVVKVADIGVPAETVCEMLGLTDEVRRP